MGICKCGQENCKGLCEYAVGRRLATFLNEVDTVQTSIGEIDNKYSKGTLIATGIKIYRDGTASTVLKELKDISIPMEQRFNGYNNKNVRLILREYINASGCNNGRELLTKLKEIEENKLVLMPFKVRQLCDVIHIRQSNNKEVNGEKVECRTEIQCVKWAIDDSGKLHCALVTTINDPDSGKKIVLKLEDYEERFKLVNLERATVSGKTQEKIIRMTRFGFIKPIEINHKDNIIIIDNCSLYAKYKDEGDIREIANWSGNKVVYAEKIKDTKLEQFVNANVEYINKHRRWIAPYGLHETNKIDIK